jgi:hypothetical protein
VVWGLGAGEKGLTQTIVDAANFLNVHLNKKQYVKEGYAVNTRIDDKTTLVFRGKDKKNRMAVLVLSTLAKASEKDGKVTPADFSLKLSYILDTENPDILTIKDDDF